MLKICFFEFQSLFIKYFKLLLMILLCTMTKLKYHFDFLICTNVYLQIFWMKPFLMIPLAPEKSKESSDLETGPDGRGVVKT